MKAGQLYLLNKTNVRVDRFLDWLRSGRQNGQRDAGASPAISIAESLVMAR
jgi:hypothetical protein